MLFLSLPRVRSYEYCGSRAHGPTLGELISWESHHLLAITVAGYTYAEYWENRQAPKRNHLALLCSSKSIARKQPFKLIQTTGLVTEVFVFPFETRSQAGQAGLVSFYS